MKKYIVFYAQETESVHFLNDCKTIVLEGKTPCEAARAFWNLMNMTRSVKTIRIVAIVESEIEL